MCFLAEDALAALLGKDADGLSTSTIGRLKDAWSEEHVRWSRRDLSAKRHVHFKRGEVARRIYPATSSSDSGHVTETLNRHWFERNRANGRNASSIGCGISSSYFEKLRRLERYERRAFNVQSKCFWILASAQL
jgi:hypothetical protein